MNMNDDPVPLLGPVNFRGVNAEGNEFDVQNYNFEIIGARHSDFSYNPTNDNLAPEQLDVNRATNFFMRELSKAAVDGFWLDAFASREGIEYDSNRGVYVVNPLVYEEENR